MDDEELRSKLKALLMPADQIPVPDVGVLRRRLRRRRTGQATAAAVVLVCVAAGLNLGLSRGTGPTGDHSPVAAGACASRDLRVTWLSPAAVSGSDSYAEGPPVTFPLAFRNVGSSDCWVDGFPRILAKAAQSRRAVSVSYLIHFDEFVGDMRSRVVEPTRIWLGPQGRALSTVTFAAPPSGGTGCGGFDWPIRPPSPGADPVRAHGGRPTLCDDESITVSPLYPGNVPLTSNYPS
jgi:hypothetical protein